MNTPQPFELDDDAPTLKMPRPSKEVLDSLRDSERALSVASDRAIKTARKCRK